MQDYVSEVKGGVTELLPLLQTGNDTVLAALTREADTISAKQHC